ncbi:MAG: hypothetical protein IK080_07840 [Clostridia bacterium]|nr:hypothetical protein [Clostridia bacterium]
MKKLICLMIAGFVFLITLASCDQKPETEPSTTETQVSETQQIIESTSENNTEEKSEPVNTETVPEESETQAESADPYEFFNKAVSLSTAKSLTYSRIAGPAVFTPDVLNSFFEDSDIQKQTAKGVSGTPALAEISKQDCSGEKLTDNGDTVTVVFNLKTAKIPAASKPAQKGYLFFMDSDEVLKSVHIVNPDLVYEKNGEITLSGGEVTAVIDKETGKFRSLTIKLHESYYDEVSKSFIDAKFNSAPGFIKNAIKTYVEEGVYSTFDYDIAAEYTF